MATPSGSTLEGFRLPRPRLTGVIAMAFAVAFTCWLAVRDDGGASEPVVLGAIPLETKAVAGGAIDPVVLTAAELRTRAASLGQRVYWVGPEPGRRYELKRTDTGQIFLRYLPPGVEAGAAGIYLTVGTYPVAGAFDVTRAIADEAGSVGTVRKDGAIAVYRESRPTNIYVAYPGLDYQVEVFSGDAAEALRLAMSDQLAVP